MGGGGGAIDIAFVPPLTCGCCRENWEETDGARRYVPVAETMETEEVVLCREICRDIVPNCDMGMGPRPGPAATAIAAVGIGGPWPGRGGGGGGGAAHEGVTGTEMGMDGVGTAMGMPMLLPPLFSRLPLPPLLPLWVLGLWLRDAVRPGLCWLPKRAGLVM